MNEFRICSYFSDFSKKNDIFKNLVSVFTNKENHTILQIKFWKTKSNTLAVQTTTEKSVWLNDRNEIIIYFSNQESSTNYNL